MNLKEVKLNKNTTYKAELKFNHPVGPFGGSLTYQIRFRTDSNSRVIDYDCPLPSDPGLEAHLNDTQLISLYDETKKEEVSILKSESTNLFDAVKQEDIHKIENIVKNNKDSINEKDRDGWTPLHLLLGKLDLKEDNKYRDILNIFLTNGGDVNIKDNKNGWMSLHYVAHAKYGNTDYINLLINKKANVNATSEKQNTPLMIAVGKKKSDIVLALLKNGADTEIRNVDSFTPLIQAIFQGSFEIAEILLKYKADVNAVDKKYHATSLHGAVFQENNAAVKLLLKYGADTNIKDYQGNTPKDIAKAKNNQSILNLIESRQSGNSKNFLSRFKEIFKG